MHDENPPQPYYPPPQQYPPQQQYPPPVQGQILPPAYHPQYYPGHPPQPSPNQQGWQKTVLWGVSIWVLGPFVVLLAFMVLCFGGCALLMAAGSSTPTALSELAPSR
jgi:hypothetical protein